MRIALFFILAIFWGGLGFSADNSGIDWNKRIDIDVAGGTIGEAISQITQQTGIIILPSKQVNGKSGDVWNEKIYLQGKKISLRQAVDWLAAIMGCRYHISSDRKIHFDYGYGWVDRRDFDMMLRNVENAVGKDRDVQAFERIIDEITKILTLFDSAFYTRIEEQGEQIKLVINMPAALKKIFETVLGDFEVSGEAIGLNKPLTLPADERELIAKLYSPVIAAYKKRPLPEVLSDLSLQSGVNICFDQNLFRGGKYPVISLDKGKMTLRAALEQIVLITHFKGISISLPNSVWLSTYPGKWGHMTGREFLWGGNTEVRCYSLNGVSPQLIEGNYLAYQIKMKVSPQSWLDPLASVVYHQVSNNLIVVAGADVQSDVEKALRRYVEKARNKK